MVIQGACQCGQPFSVPDQFAGQQGKCQKCGNIMTIPAANPPASDPFANPPAANPPASDPFAALPGSPLPNSPLPNSPLPSSPLPGSPSAGGPPSGGGTPPSKKKKKKKKKKQASEGFSLTEMINPRLAILLGVMGVLFVILAATYMFSSTPETDATILVKYKSVLTRIQIELDEVEDAAAAAERLTEFQAEIADIHRSARPLGWTNGNPTENVQKDYPEDHTQLEQLKRQVADLRATLLSDASVAETLRGPLDEINQLMSLPASNAMVAHGGGSSGSAYVPVATSDGPVQANSNSPSVQQEIRSLTGKWTVTRAGKPDELQSPSDELTVTFTHDEMTTTSPTRPTRVAQYVLDPTRLPKAIDFTIAGIISQGIYEIQGDTLRILTGKNRPVNFSPSAERMVMIVMIRAKDRTGRTPVPPAVSTPPSNQIV
ncbi:MAG: TIGR03067 domain-containing protein, partial [Planctomycetales bacterium]